MLEALDQSSDGENDSSEPTLYSRSPSLAQPGQSNFVIYHPDVFQGMGSALQHPPHSQVQSLYLSFMTNVDPAVKMLHGPSLRRYLGGETSELVCSPGPKGLDALKFAIYYTTTTSLTAEECFKLLGEEKTVLLNRYRSSTEIALASADFVNVAEISSLQALVFYLVSRPFTLFSYPYLYRQ